MNVTINAEIIGLDKVVESVFEKEKIFAAVERACALLEREAKKKAPKDTGALRRSITSEVSYEGEDVVGVVYTPLEYAPYVEYGTGLFAEGGDGRKDVPWRYQDDEGNWHSTSGQHPQPFMRPAFDENKDKIAKIIAEGIVND